MNRDLLRVLACPDCHQQLTLDVDSESGGEVESGALQCAACPASFPIVRFVPRFVPASNYADSFGFQWNQFRRTQLDSHSGHPITRQRFYAQSGWQPADLSGRWTLDAGCGAGRFAEVALNDGARVVAVDASSAVDACRLNLGPHPRLDAVQADLYRLPFRRQAFEFVYCFGVLQHTPDTRGAFESIIGQLAPDARIAVDVYPRLALNVIWPKYLLRPLTKRVSTGRLFPLVNRMVNLLWPVSLLLGRVPGIGRHLRYVLPIVNYEGVLPLNVRQLKEWALLDTFDMLAPAHDHPVSVATLRTWFQAASLADIEVARRGLVVGRGRKPAGQA